MSALRLRPLMTYAYPHWAIQLRIALIRVHLALADVAGARTLMREIDEILKRRPDLGTLADEAGALRAQLAQQRGSSAHPVRGGAAHARHAVHEPRYPDPAVLRPVNSDLGPYLRAGPCCLLPLSGDAANPPFG